MNKFRLMRSTLVASVLLTLSSFSFACSECEYSDSLGVCWPKDKCVINQLNPITNVKNVLTIVQAVATGDPKQITTSIGQTLVNSPGCLGCASVAHTLLPTLSDAQIYSAVGTGFLTFVSTGDPVLVLFSAAGDLASEQKVKAAPSPVAPVARPGRRKKVYTATAACLVSYKDGTYYAGWTDPAPFYNSSGAKFTYPDIDLMTGDTLNVTADICPSWNSPSTGQVSVRSGSFEFDSVSTLAGGPKVIKWFAYGKKI